MADLEQTDTELARPLAEESELDLVAVEIRGEGSRSRIRVVLDRKGGVDVGTCQRISRSLGRSLDALDPVNSRYTLEVTSPGTDRPGDHPLGTRHHGPGPARSVVAALDAWSKRSQFTGEEDLVFAHPQLGRPHHPAGHAARHDCLRECRHPAGPHRVREWCAVARPARFPCPARPVSVYCQARHELVSGSTPVLAIQAPAAL